MSAAVPEILRDLLAFTKANMPVITDTLDFVNVMTYDLKSSRDIRPGTRLVSLLRYLQSMRILTMVWRLPSSISNLPFTLSGSTQSKAYAESRQNVLLSFWKIPRLAAILETLEHSHGTTGCQNSL